MKSYFPLILSKTADKPSYKGKMYPVRQVSLKIHISLTDRLYFSHCMAPDE